MEQTKNTQKPTIPAWTASSLDLFKTCPYRFYRQRVVRDVQDVMGEKAKWGVKVHKAFEDAVNYGDPLPPSCQQWAPLVEKVKGLTGEKLPEFKFSITDAFLPTAWTKAWSRGIADLVVRSGETVAILDYKTGKRKASDQLSLYAGFAFAYWPEVQTVHTAFVWLPDRKIDRKAWKREETQDIWSLWLPTVRRMELAYEKNDWPARPCGLCKGWCPVKDCQFNGGE